MVDINETVLPGVGIRHDFITKRGRAVGVISHRTGHRELLIFDRKDPDSCLVTIRLSDEESIELAELLGVPHVSEELIKLRQSMEGVTIDWLQISEDHPAVGVNLQSLVNGSDLSAQVVAVVRAGDQIILPTPELLLKPGDTAVFVGSPAGIEAAFARLSGEPVNS